MAGARTTLLAGLIAIGALVTAPGALGATLVVETGTDEITANGDCSLREAVIAANSDIASEDCGGVIPSGADRIEIPGSLSPITLTTLGADEEGALTGDLDVRESVTIVGTDAGPVTIAGSGDRVIDAPGTIDNVEVDLTLQDLVITEGAVQVGDPVGGGIRFDAGNGGGNELTLERVTVENNQVQPSAEITSFGGGVAADGSNSDLAVTVEESLITANSAGGGNTTRHGQGGGLWLGGEVAASVNDSALVDNHAGGGSGGGVGFGGAIEATTSGTSFLTLTDTQVQDNTAGNGGPNAGFNGGGGLALLSSSGTLTVSIADGPSASAEVVNNQVGGGVGTSTPGTGGGIYADDSGGGQLTLTLAGVEVTNNHAGGDGGSGQGQGGGIATFVDGLTRISGGSISTNDAGFEPGAPTPIGNGGGIYSSFSEGDLTIIGTTLADNRAGEDSGTGGAIHMDSDGDLEITGATISSNSAGTAGATAASSGGGIDRQSGTEDPFDTITTTTISGNTASGDTSVGGGIAFATSGSLNVDASSLTGNTARAGGLAFGGGLALESDGGDHGSFNVVNSTVHDNEAEGTIVSGGGIGSGLFFSAPLLDVAHSTITANTADISGGGEGGGDGGNIAAYAEISFPGSFTLRATIVADGLGTASSSNCFQENAGVIESEGENVERTSPTQCALGAVGDQVGIDPILGPLALNGEPAGSPMTRALLVGSPAVDSVDSGCPPPATDERGVARPQGSACDAGAFELVPTTAPPPGGGPSARCAGRRATKVGTRRRDKLRGTRKKDVIAGLGGNDLIRGLAGNDVICGGRGKDRLIGGRGRDRLIGGKGRDRLNGGPGRDRLLGGPGPDRLMGGPGRDVILGHAGRDVLRGGPGRDKLRGGPGRDRLIQ